MLFFSAKKAVLAERRQAPFKGGGQATVHGYARAGRSLRISSSASACLCGRGTPGKKRFLALCRWCGCLPLLSRCQASLVEAEVHLPRQSPERCCQVMCEPEAPQLWQHTYAAKGLSRVGSNLHKVWPLPVGLATALGRPVQAPPRGRVGLAEATTPHWVHRHVQIPEEHHSCGNLAVMVSSCTLSCTSTCTRCPLSPLFAVLAAAALGGVDCWEGGGGGTELPGLSNRRL